MNVFISENQNKKKQSVLNSLPIKIIKVEIPANSASITPPLGPLLGQYGININEFCKEFNEESLFIEKDTIIPIVIYLGANKQYYFEFKTITVAYLIKKIIESLEIDELLLSKEEFLKIAYNICFFKLNIFSLNNLNEKSISKKYFMNYLNSIIGTMRSFNIKIIK